MARSLVAAGVDLIAALTALGAVLIAITGGGTFHIAHWTVQAHSTGLAVLLVATLVLGRALLLGRQPLLGLSAIDGDAVADRADASLRRLTRRLIDISPQAGRTLVAWVAVVSLGLLVANAAVHFGFFSGDDVEIHEMTFSRLFNLHWPIWNLRSPFYPMTFIYPAQAAFLALGVSKTGPLVLVGRLVVAILSTLTIPLLYRVACTEAGRATACLATLLFAANRLHLAFGSTELPRPVATVFVLLAYAALTRKSAASSVIAGGFIAVAGAMRFSEAMFVLPAVVSLAVERRGRDICLCVGAFLVSVGAILGVADAWYWGHAFASARAMVTYTLVQRLSSRGYQPVWFYLTAVSTWSNACVVGLAAWGSRRGQWKAAIWAWLPLATLSALPHKEPRYLIPIMPFVALLAAAGLHDLLVRTFRDAAPPAPSRSRRVWALAILLALSGTLIFESDGVHFRRSEPEVRLAEGLARLPGVTGVAAEQAWRLGGHLYLRTIQTVEDLDPDGLVSGGLLEIVASRPAIDTIAVSERTCAVIQCGARVTSAGYREQFMAEATSARYRVFRRSP